MASFSIAVFLTRQKTESQTKVLDEVKFEMNAGKDLYLFCDVLFGAQIKCKFSNEMFRDCYQNYKKKNHHLILSSHTDSFCLPTALKNDI